MIKTTHFSGEDCTTQVTGIVLAGGQGRRFNFKDKGWLQWQGQSFINAVIDALHSQVNSIVVCCNQNQARYEALGVDTCNDLRPSFQGPLAGVEAGLAHCQTPLALLYPVDCLPPPENLVSVLYKALRAEQADIVYLDAQPIAQYLIALVNVEQCRSVSAYLDKGEHSVKHWYASMRCRPVTPDPQWKAIHNINTPEHLDSV